MEKLIGNKIIDIQIAAEEHYLKFVTEQGEFIYGTEGDCCSETWFSEILNVDFLINHTVSEIENLYLPEPAVPDPHGRQESDCFYGIKINTDAGTATIVFRNSSNGYYGGSYDLMKVPVPQEYPFRSIKECSDWTAYEKVNNSYIHTLKLKAFL